MSVSLYLEPKSFLNSNCFGFTDTASFIFEYEADEVKPLLKLNILYMP